MEDKAYKQLHDQPSKLRKRFGRGLTVFLVVAACVLFYFLLSNIGSIWAVVKKFFSILSSIWFGVAFAYLLNPLMKRIEKLWCRLVKEKPGTNPEKRKKHTRIVAVIFTMLIFLAIIVVLINMIIPQLYKSIVQLINILPDQIDNLEAWAKGLDPSSTLGVLIMNASEKAVSFVENWVENDLVNNIGVMAAGVVNTVKGVVNFIIGIIITVYFLLGKEKFVAGIKRFMFSTMRKERANFILHISRRSDKIFGSFIVGNIVDSAIIGLLCFIFMSIFKFSQNYTLLISVIVGVTNIIPFFGPIIGTVPGAFLILLEHPINAVYFVIFIIVLQQLDGNVIKPAILGESTGLSSFWIIFAILLGGGFFGFLGMLLGVPCLAVIFYILDMVLADKLREKGLPEENNFYENLRYVREDGSYRFNDAEALEQDEEIRKQTSLFRKIRILFEKRKKTDTDKKTDVAIDPDSEKQDKNPEIIPDNDNENPDIIPDNNNEDPN